MKATTSSDDFRLTTSCVVNRLHQRYGVNRSADTVRMWGRLGKLPVLELENGQRLFRASDVDALAARISAADDVLADERHAAHAG